MMSFTPKEHQDSSKIKLKDDVCTCPSKLTIRIIVSYASALRVYKTKSLGFTNVLLN